MTNIPEDFAFIFYQISLKSYSLLPIYFCGFQIRKTSKMIQKIFLLKKLWVILLLICFSHCFLLFPIEFCAKAPVATVPVTKTSFANS